MKSFLGSSYCSPPARIHGNRFSDVPYIAAYRAVGSVSVCFACICLCPSKFLLTATRTQNVHAPRSQHLSPDWFAFMLFWEEGLSDCARDVLFLCGNR